MKIGAFGEVMLRLTPPEQLLLEQTNTLRMSFTGTGVNLLSNLAHFGFESFLLTALPNNRLGEAALSKLQSLGINTKMIRKQHDHLGTYFAEVGFGVRPTQVTYQNRTNSSFGLSKILDYDLTGFLRQVDLIHICGISLSLTDRTAEAALELAKRAYENNKKVCFDFNFRPSLNQEPKKKQQLRSLYEKILPYCSIIFGSSRDLIELLQEEPTNDDDKNIMLIQKFLKKYDIEWFAGTQRETTIDNKKISGYLITQTESFQTKMYNLKILDRIGAGDAYAAGILLGYAEKWSLAETVEFALANAVLAHTIHGDVPLTTREQVYQILHNPTVDLIR
ncbi:sugar kinase [Enterococcus sp. LJL99]